MSTLYIPQKAEAAGEQLFQQTEKACKDLLLQMNKGITAPTKSYQDYLKKLQHTFDETMELVGEQPQRFKPTGIMEELPEAPAPHGGMGRTGG